jgi:hypothetical protein
VSFTEKSARTAIDMTIAITQVRPEAIEALAGVKLGWQQTLDRLAALLADA